MRLLRRTSCLAVLALGAAVFAGPAFGARPAIPLPFTLGTTHFLVHYQSDTVNAPSYAITQTTAGDIAALAERAYAAETADGYAAPPTDSGLGGDDRIDIYVVDPGLQGVLGVTVPDSPAAVSTSSYILLNGTTPEAAFDQHTIAHELFHVLQLGIWQPQQVSDYWLLEGSAEWMGYRVDNYNIGTGLDLGPADESLDCRDPLGTSQCDFDVYLGNGYSRWPFFEYLSEHFGTSFVQTIFQQGAAGAGTALDSVKAALAAKGTNLADTYNAWDQADLVGSYSVSALQAQDPLIYGRLQTGTKAGNLATFQVPVNHLSTRVLQFTRGDGDASHVCYSATLNVTVTIPAGTQSKPVFWWNALGNAPLPLSVNGSTATAAIPWDTCTYSGTKGFLTLPNASSPPSAVDAADFVVKASLSVDQTKPVTPASPPPGATTNTPVVQVPSADIAPALALFAPQVLQLSANQSELRLVVESNNVGAVQAKLGATVIGTADIRAGENAVAFKLPTAMLTALRSSASAGSTLTLTPTSPDNSTIGQQLTRTLRIQPAVKTKAKVKVKVKAKLHRK